MARHRFAQRTIILWLLAGAVAFAAADQKEQLKRRQATIKGMVVRTLANGKFTGMAVGIIATAGKAHKGGRVTIRGKIGDDMKSALEEAARYIRVEHPDVGNCEIEVSFEDRYSPKDGGSAGTAFALLLRSLTDGYEIDPLAAVTGDIAVNGKVTPIGGLTAKLRGVMTDGCKLALIPADNVPAFGDLMVRNDQMIEMLRGLQVFSIATVDDAVKIVSNSRDEKIAQAVQLYSELQADMVKRGAAAFKSRDGQEKLATILDLAPNHVSAKFALDIAKGKGPKTLTRSGSLAEIFAAAWPFWEVVAAKNAGPIDRSKLPASTLRSVKTDLNALRRLTHPDVENLRKSLVTWIETVDTILSADRNTRVTEADIKIIDQRREALLKELKRLDTDETLLAKMMREGY